MPNEFGYSAQILFFQSESHIRFDWPGDIVVKISPKALFTYSAYVSYLYLDGVYIDTYLYWRAHYHYKVSAAFSEGLAQYPLKPDNHYGGHTRSIRYLEKFVSAANSTDAFAG